MADGARVAVQAALHADEAKTAGPVLRRRCVGLIVVTVMSRSTFEPVNKRAVLDIHSNDRALAVVEYTRVTASCQ